MIIHYTQKRDAEIEKTTNVDYFTIEDYNLLPINTIKPKSGKNYYTKFRPFMINY